LDEVTKPSDSDIFARLTYDDISALSPTFVFRKINSTHGPLNEMPKGTIILFETVEGNYGKMLLLNNTSREYVLDFKYCLYDNTGKLLKDSHKASIFDTFTFDFEASEASETTDTIADFWWEWTEFHGGGKSGDPIYLTPQIGSLFTIYK
jgi:hypothetical protein